MDEWRPTLFDQVLAEKMGSIDGLLYLLGKRREERELERAMHRRKALRADWLDSVPTTKWSRTNG